MQVPKVIFITSPNKVNQILHNFRSQNGSSCLPTKFNALAATHNMKLKAQKYLYSHIKFEM